MIAAKLINTAGDVAGMIKEIPGADAGFAVRKLLCEAIAG
jgi:hypothetical protein